MPLSYNGLDVSSSLGKPKRFTVVIRVYISGNVNKNRADFTKRLDVSSSLGKCL